MQTQKTALYKYHKTLGAKFVPFAGYEMPIQYKDGIVKEHISTRTHAGFFDVSHMGQFFLEGDNTLIEALEKIIPSDLKSLQINPNANCGTPSKKPIKISWLEKLRVSDIIIP